MPLILLSVLFASITQAALVTFEPGAYTGSYFVLGQTGQVSGTQVLDLVAGNYTVQVGGHNQGRFDITVDGLGNVTSSNTAAASGLGSTLTFNTTNMTIDPAAYSGGFFLLAVTGQVSGIQNLVVVPNLNYLVQVGGHNQGRFQIDIDAAGDVTSTNAAAASGLGSTLTFNTTNMTIDPAAYSGGFFLLAVTGQVSGIQNLVVVPNLNYLVQVGGHNQGRFQIDIDAAGDVTSTNAAAASGLGSTLTFNTTNITIDPAAYSGGYFLFVVTGEVSGIQDLVVVPNLNYLVQVGGHNQGRFQIDIDATGNVTSTNLDAASSTAATLTFNTVEIEVIPGDVTPWFIRAVTPQIVGAANVLIVPTLAYRFESSGLVDIINIGSPCSVSPNQLVQAGTTFDLSCFQPPSFSCQNKTDYPIGGCAGKFVATSLADLDTYALDFGLEAGNFKHLKIDFDITGTDIEIHSPCEIRIRSNRSIVADNICLDGREAVRANKNFTASGINLAMLSQNGRAVVRKNSNLTFETILIKAKSITAIRRHSTVAATDSLTLQSTGSSPDDSRAILGISSQIQAGDISLISHARSRVNKNASIIADSLSIVADDKAVLAKGTQVILSGAMSLTSTGVSGRAKVGKNASVQAGSMSMSTTDTGVLGKNSSINIGGLFDFSAGICKVSPSALITAGSQSGNCLTP